MAERYIVGIDLGTTSAKCVIYDEQGNVHAEAQKDMVIHYPSPGQAEQDAGDFYTFSREIVRRCLAEPGIEKERIAAVGISSQMGGILPIDKDYNPATYYDTPLDGRSAAENTWMHAEYGDAIIEQNGSISTFGNKVLYWKKREEWKRIHKFIQPSAFVAGKLTGLSGDDAYMDETFICFSGLADLRNGTWSDELCDAMDVDMRKLPRIVKSSEVIGEVCSRAAEDTGLPKGIPVVAGCGDQIAGFTGAGILNAGQMADVSGTACILGLRTDRYLFDKEHRTLACLKSALGEGYYLISVVLGGRTHNWYIEQFCKEEIEAAAERGISVYEYLDEKARDIPPGSENLVSINYLQGRFFPPEPHVRGLFVGHSWAHTKYHFYRSILESIAYDHYLTRGIMEELAPHLEFSTISAIGSGARSDLWLKIKADVMRQTYLRLVRSDLATLGAAIVAGYGVDIFEDIGKITSKFGNGDYVQKPDAAEFKKYEKSIGVYQELFPLLMPVYNHLAGG